QRANRAALVVPGPGRVGWSPEPHVAGLGQLFQSGRGGRGLSHRGHPRMLSAPSVAGTTGARAGARSITILGTLLASHLWAHQARRPSSWHLVSDRVIPCPRAG